jgi:hypothetical protein
VIGTSSYYCHSEKKGATIGKEKFHALKANLQWLMKRGGTPKLPPAHI